jgi:3-oxo-5-alpha-steroid 4-dehydrogenase 3
MQFQWHQYLGSFYNHNRKTPTHSFNTCLSQLPHHCRQLINRRVLSTCKSENMEPHGFFEDIFNHLSSLSPGAWCQASVLAVAAVPGDARALLADYGARKADSNSKPKHPDEQSPTSRSTGNSNDSNTIGSKLVSLLDALTTATQVPHSWFAYFYVLSVACSAFWLLQYLLDGEMLRFLAAQQQDQQPQDASATFSQSALGWLMMTAQAGRRVFEHAFVIKPSRGSSMWVVHWVLGLGFYVVMSVAVWIEGSGTRVAWCWRFLDRWCLGFVD